MRRNLELLAIRAITLALTLAAAQTSAWAAGQLGTDADSDPLLTFPHEGPVFTDGTPRADHEPMFLTRAQTPGRRATAVRFGWWATDVSGNPLNNGEYQEFGSSAFYDIDRLSSDGQRTIDLSITGVEDESNDVRIYYFGPNLSVDFDYERFPHRLDHNPLDAWLNTPDTAQLVGEDFNVGQEYAIRVNTLDLDFKGHVSENVKWKLGFWGMRKQGQRQATALNHTCTERQCHMVSQSKRIDWLTMQIEPAIEVKCGPVTAEYSRTMRAFTNNDGAVTRSYVGRPVAFVDTA